MDHPAANTRDTFVNIFHVCPDIRACSDVLDSLDKEAVLFAVLALKRPNRTGWMYIL